MAIKMIDVVTNPTQPTPTNSAVDFCLGMQGYEHIKCLHVNRWLAWPHQCMHNIMWAQCHAFFYSVPRLICMHAPSQTIRHSPMKLRQENVCEDSELGATTSMGLKPGESQKNRASVWDQSQEWANIIARQRSRQQQGAAIRQWDGS